MPGILKKLFRFLYVSDIMDLGMQPLPTSRKRRHPRYDVESVDGELKTLLEARLLDWSATGLSFESTSWLAPGQRFVLRIRDRSPSMAVDGRVAWSSLTGTLRDEVGDLQPVYRTGVELDPLSPRQARQMLTAFRHLGNQQWEEHRPGRFAAPEPVPLVLELEYEMKVRRMSRSGMLLETGMAPHLESRLSLHVNLEGRRIRSRGRVAYRDSAAGDGHRVAMRLGVEFVDMSADDEHVLGEFLHDVANRVMPPVTS